MREIAPEVAADLARLAVQKGADAAEVLIRENTEFSVGVRLGEVETLKESADRGIGIRVLLDGKQASVSGSDFSESAILSLIEEAIEMARLTSVDESAGLPEAQEFIKEIDDLNLFDEAVASLSPEIGIEMALAAEAAAKAYSPLIVNFEGGGFGSGYGTETFANSLGFAGQYRGTSCSLSMVPVAAEGGKMQRDYWYDMRRRLSELEGAEAIGRKAAERTVRKLGARPVATQRVPVIFESGVAREILSDLLQAVSGDAVFRKASFLAGKLGEPVANDKVTIIDDGRLQGGLGSRPFDSEGIPTRRTIVMQNGVLESYLLNTYTARKLGLRSTGNCARGLVGSVGIEAGNLYLEPGNHSLTEMIGSVKNGFLITELLGFGVNIVTGDYSRSAAGLWIENGETVFPVQGVTVAGNLKRMLQAIEMIGDDLEFRNSVASPSLLIGEMTISA